MSDEHRDLDDCTKSAKESLVDTLEGGENYLRKHGCDDTVSTLLFECADGAVPTYTGELLDVFGEAQELWYTTPDCGMDGGDNGVIGIISRVIYDAISEALHEYVAELEGDDLECDVMIAGTPCGTPDDHDPIYSDPPVDHVRCKAHCDGAPDCEPCQEEQDAEADDDPCPTCGKPPEEFMEGDCGDCNPTIESLTVSPPTSCGGCGWDFAGEPDHVAAAQDSGNCPNCGRTLPRRAPATAPLETIPYAQQVDMGQRCANCGAELRAHWSASMCCPSGTTNFQAAPPEGRITHQECGCPIGGPHRRHRINTGRTPTAAYTVGLVNGTGSRHGFATEDEAAAYIETLPDHADGRYYLDGPPDEAEPHEADGAGTFHYCLAHNLPLDGTGRCSSCSPKGTG